MDVNEVLENLVHFGQYDWIRLWAIVQDAEDLVGVEDEDRILETTLALRADCCCVAFGPETAPWKARFGSMRGATKILIPSPTS